MAAVNFGKFDTRIKKHVFENGLLKQERRIYAKSEVTDRRCIYSQFGTAAREAVEIQAYKSAGIARNTPLYINGSFYIPSAVIVQDNKLYVKALCGKANQLRFSTNIKKVTLDENRKARLEADSNTEFDGFILEKYINVSETEVHQTSISVYILMCAKDIELKVGATVKQSGNAYIITAAHTLDDMYNEYEIKREADV